MFARPADSRCSAEDVASVVATLHAGWLAPGDKSAELERTVAAKCSKRFGLVVNSHKSALFLACLSLGIGPGTEVVVPALAPSFHLEMLRLLKAPIRHVDIDLATLSVPADVRGTVLTGNLLAIPDRFAGARDTIIEDLGSNIVSTSGSAAAVLSFDNLCGIALFDDEQLYTAALSCRDWGRVGGQDEAMGQRYDARWVLGKNVLYDTKFVYARLGFNFRSCEMSAVLALRTLGDTPEAIDGPAGTADEKVSRNGYTLFVRRGRAGVGKTFRELDFALAKVEGQQFINAEDVFEHVVVVLTDRRPVDQ
jgi:hypothetical protein